MFNSNNNLKYDDVDDDVNALNSSVVTLAFLQE